MRVIFLDFDGVLHPVEAGSLGLEYFCWLPVLYELLAKHADVRVVVHSTWRYEYSDEQLQTLLGPVGTKFVGSTPRGPRELAIETVLQANKSIRHHLVLDDAREEFSGTRVNLVLTDSQLGLSDKRAQKAIAKWLSATALRES